MQKEFNGMKEEYKNIRASEDLKKNVGKILKRKSRILWMQRLVASLTLLLLTGVISLNMHSGLAYAVAEVPGLQGLVRIVTFSKYEFKDNGYEAKVEVPQIEGLLDPAMEDELNRIFRENGEAVIRAFEEDVRELKADFGEDTVHMGLEYNYQIKTDNEEILALDIYLFQAAGSSSTVHSFYTIDKKTGSLITLESLFKEDADYVRIISDYLREEMRRQNQEDGGMFWLEEETEEWNFKEIRSDQNFYINRDGQLVICFDKYEVAAGAAGSPEFPIPEKVMKEIRK
jgi:hypothetical protein